MIGTEQPARKRDEDADDLSERAWGALVLAWFGAILGAVMACVAWVAKALLRDDDE